MASDHPIAAMVVATLLGAAMVLSEVIATALPSVVFLLYLAVASTLFLRGVIVWYQHRDPRKPRVPRLAQARLRSLPTEPPRQVHEIAYNCVICGRPLTNPQSMRARVGSTCIQRYGPRYKMVPNPEHERWRALLAAAEADRAAEQARLNLEHQEAMAQYERLVRAWESEVASPEGQARRRGRATGRRLTLIGVASMPALFVGVAVALPLI